MATDKLAAEMLRWEDETVPAFKYCDECTGYDGCSAETGCAYPEPALRAEGEASALEQVEIDRLRSELDHFTKSGIIEIAVRNPNVSSWMVEWENRALKAEATISALEAENKRLREALEPFARFAEFVAENHPGWDHDEFDIGPLFVGLVTMGNFRRARDLSRNRRETP